MQTLIHLQGGTGMSYHIVVITDGKETFKKDYDNCLQAVHDYDKFVDVGCSGFGQLIYLVEPDGTSHQKYFSRKP
jgi:hypothetical protein